MVLIHAGARDDKITVEQAIAKLTEFPKDKAQILSTIHKAKGLEWGTVTYLNYIDEVRGPQESNCKYVGCTRSKNILNLHMESRR
jgi:superfamily I DNA/RNA helicase